MELKPKAHQQRAIELFSNKNQLLAHEMGTGKTLTAIWIHQSKGAVIFCPAKLKRNWEVELKKVGETDVQVIKKKKDLVENRKWIIISYSVAYDFIGRLPFYSGCISDESHFIKGKSKRAKGVMKICSKMDLVTLLSGTPIMNKPIELWNQLKCLNAEITREYSRTSFSEKFCGGHMRTMGRRTHWWEGGANELDLLKEKIANDVDIIKKADVLDLEPKLIIPVEIEMSADEKREYRNKWKNYLAWCDANPVYHEVLYCYEAGNKRYPVQKTVTMDEVNKLGGELAFIDSLRGKKFWKKERIDNLKQSQQLVELGKLRQVTSLAKVNYFLSELEEIGEQQCIVFTQFVESLNVLNEGLKKAGVSYSTLNEDENGERFRRKEVQVFTANMTAGGQGLNLQNASLMFILDRDWTPGQNEQAEDRIHRMGQTERCVIYYYSCVDTVDVDKVNEANAKKKKIINKIMS